MLTDTTSLTTTFALSDTDRYTLTNVTPGAYTVTEEDPGFGIRLSDLRCDDQNSATPSTTNLAARTAAINLDAGETVTCRFTNTADDIVIIEKVTYPAGGSGFDFTNTITGPFSLDDGDFTVLDVPAIGTHTITETDPGPAWDVSAIDCAILAPSGVITPVSGNLQTGAVDLPLNQPGELAFCLYQNTQRSTITITKQAAPADNTSFNFSGDLGSFSLQDPANSSKVFTQVVPGVYTITETAGADWRLDQVLCRSANGATSYKSNENQGQLVVDLAAGDDVTCDFISIKPPKLTVVKQTSGGDGTFEFTALGPISPTFSLATQSGSGQQLFSNLYSSTYAITETVPAGWQQTGATCSNNSTPDNFSLSAGDVVTCTFVNEPTPFCQASSWAVSNETELNDAIACYNAKNVAGSYAITVTQDITLTASSRAIDSTNPNAILTIAGNYNAVDGQDIAGVRPFTVLTDTIVNMDLLTIKGGNVTDAGGGILNYGKIRINFSTITANSAGTGGGGVANFGGLALNQSTVSGNSATQIGGGVYNANTSSGASLQDSTVSGNSAGPIGGGIYSEARLELEHVTMSGNSVSGTGPSGGALYVENGDALIANSILANSSGAEDCYRSGIGPAVTDQGHNLIETQSDCGFTNGVNGNIVGQDPLLGPLADNGGPTFTHAPLAGSPVIDQITSLVISSDQRGATRPFPFGAKEDIGAVEATCYADSWPVGSERELDVAIVCYNAKTAPNSYVITVTKNISLTDITRPINNKNSGVQLVLEGGNHTLDGQGLAEVRPLTIQPDTDVTINDLTVTGGNMTSADEFGGGLYVGGTLTLNDSTVTGNTVAASGGGIYVSDNTGTLTVNRSTISGNTAGTDGGGVFNENSLTANQSTVSGNTAANFGGGIRSEGSVINLSNTTLSGNTAASGGGLYNRDLGTLDSVTIVSNTVTGGSGAGLYLFTNDINLTNSIIAQNSGSVNCFSLSGVDGGNNLVQSKFGLCTVAGDIEGVDPLLGPLADNGGPTLTHAPLDGSPVVDAGSTTLTVDQRGVSRPFDNEDDIGAVESFLCADDNWSVSNEAELDRAITCFNSKTVAATHIITLTDDIDLTTSTPVINNITATLVITSDDYGVYGNRIPGVRPFEIAANTTVTMNGLTVWGGNVGNDTGGGIKNAGNLTLNRVAIQENETEVSGGGIHNELGGTLTMNQSTVSDNSAITTTATTGGGISNAGTLTINNSTISGNSATSGGGLTNSGGTLTLDSVTIAANTGSSGLFTVFNPVAVKNSILADNSGGSDCATSNGGSITDNGYNLVETVGSCTFSAGTSTTGSDPLLGPLADNGGDTETHTLLPGSPAIDKGDTTLTVDQRGVSRLTYAPADIGAVESSCGTGNSWEAGTEDELDTAIGCFNGQTVAGSYTITVTANISLTGPIADINNPNSGPGLVIVGGSHTIDGGFDPLSNVGQKGFDIQSPTAVAISDLTMTRLHSLLTGAAIHNTGGGALTLNNMTLTINVAGGGGAAINSLGPVTVTNSTISNNDQPGTFGFYGGAILIQSPGSLTLIDSEVSGNTAVHPGAGIYATSGTSLTIEGSLISGNISDIDGGGIYLAGTATISNSTVSNNTAAEYGGGIKSLGTLTLTDTDIDGNTADRGGAGVENDGTITVTGVTFRNNTAGTGKAAGTGGGFQNQSGSASFINSTFSGNQATGTSDDGGGGMMVYGGTVNLRHVTIANNSSAAKGGGISVYNGIVTQDASGGTLAMDNTLVGDNSAVGSGPDIYGPVTSNDYNMIENITGATITPQAHDITGDDPKLDPLADNGGSTWTIALQTGSRAIDAGNSSLTTDQRGVTRPVGLRNDIGAFEAAVQGGTIIIRKYTAPVGALGAGFNFTTSGFTPDFTLKDKGKEVVHNVASGTYTVTEEAHPTYELSGISCTDSNTSGAASTWSVASRTATINLEPGETVRCTFTNAEDGSITVEKITQPDSTDIFGYTGDLGSFNVTAGTVQAFTGKDGTYTITETKQDGYKLTSLSCTDSSGASVGTVSGSGVMVSLASTQQIHCTFISTKANGIYLPIIYKADQSGIGPAEK